MQYFIHKVIKVYLETITIIINFGNLFQNVTALKVWHFNFKITFIYVQFKHPCSCASTVH